MTLPSPVVDVYHSMTVLDIYQAVGQSVVSRWELLGQTESKVHWAYGAEADALISERFPAMNVYKAIAIKAGVSSQTIRKAYYTYKSFTLEVREKYNLAPYSIFQHARTQKDPIKVLEHYINNASSVDEVETIFPIVEDEEFEKVFTDKGYPRIFYGIYREVFGIDPFLLARVEEHLNEIKAIIEQVNK